jgi:hypothetical protein
MLTKHAFTENIRNLTEDDIVEIVCEQCKTVLGVALRTPGAPDKPVLVDGCPECDDLACLSEYSRFLLRKGI